MNRSITQPGETIDLAKFSQAIPQNEELLLVRDGEVEITLLAIEAGQEIPTYEAAGQIILHCLQGCLSVNAYEENRELKAGQLLYLLLNEPFTIHAIEGSVVLATVVALKRGDNVELIGRSRQD